MTPIEVLVSDEVAERFAALSEAARAELSSWFTPIIEDKILFLRLAEARERVQSRITEQEAEEIMREVLADD